MKTFLITVLLFALLLTFIIYNYFKINSISDKLISMTNAISPVDSKDCLTLSLRLASEWEKTRDFISFSCGLSKLDTITDLTECLCFYAETGSADQFELTRRLLINDFEDIAEFESLRPADVF